MLWKPIPAIRAVVYTNSQAAYRQKLSDPILRDLDASEIVEVTQRARQILKVVPTGIQILQSFKLAHLEEKTQV